jgi:glucose-1-phosphate cytidylyltransferase
MKVVILAGGLGTRLREETEYRPKPMVEIGERPIIWHLMKNFAHQGFEDFVIALGYKGNQLRDFFLNLDTRFEDLTVDTGTGAYSFIRTASAADRWKVSLVDTGFGTTTAGRLLRLAAVLGEERFVCAYGDGLANVNIPALLDFHKSHGRLATLTVSRPTSRFGLVEFDSDGTIIRFAEKPQDTQWVNIGFFVFEPKAMSYMEEGSALETIPLQRLAADRQLMAFQHDGFWKPMDTFRETQEFNDMWARNEAPWRNW